MASAFNTTVPTLEDELTQLILDGEISARIDSHAKVVTVCMLLGGWVRVCVCVRVCMCVCVWVCLCVHVCVYV